MRVVIAGGGISGLIAAHTFIEAGHTPVIIDGGTLGGQWAKLRALKYLRYTPRPMGHPADLGAMLRSLGLQAAVIPVRGAAMLPVEGRKRPVVVPHPTCMRWKGLGEAFLEAHWAKTRGAGPPDARAMNTGDGARDRADSSPDCRVEVEGGDFLDALILRVRTGAEVWEYDGLNWIWVSGSDETNQQAEYGIKGVPDSSNMPRPYRSGYSPICGLKASGQVGISGAERRAVRSWSRLSRRPVSRTSTATWTTSTPPGRRWDSFTAFPEARMGSGAPKRICPRRLGAAR